MVVISGSWDRTRQPGRLHILGITNHRVPNYELPSNIPGLTFSDPLAKAQELADQLRPTNDVVIALTHIGFTEDPKSVEVDKNVDTTMAAETTGLDLIVGGHSHTDPSKPTAASGAYKYLPAIVAGPSNTPVLVTQAYRYNTYLGEVFLGMRAKAGGGYEVVSRAGQYLSVTSGIVEDPDIKTIVDPYIALFNTYNNTVVGQTTVPIDALQAYTQETNGANLQAVLARQVDVATNNTEDFGKLQATKPELASQIRVLWTSPLIPSDPFVWHKDLDPAIKAKLKSFVLGYAKTDAEEKAILGNIYSYGGFRESNNDQLIPIRQLELAKQRAKVETDNALDSAAKTRALAEIDAKLAALKS